MPLSQIDPKRYPELLAQKRTTLNQLLAHLGAPDAEVFSSPELGFRMRAEFRMWHEEERCHYVMFHPDAPKEPVIIDAYPIGSPRIQQLMPQLQAAVESDEILRRKLFQVEFLTTLSGEALVTLIYHRALDEAWENRARALMSELGIELIGRSRKQRLVLGRDHLMETLQVAHPDGTRPYHYMQIENSFTQPNAQVNQKMLSWAVSQTHGWGGDLIELYCGNGNFTLPLSRNFDRVLATEISKTSIRAAQHNVEANGVDNLAFARLSAEEFTQAMNGVREFRRLREFDIRSYRFDTVFVDPPRAGLDVDTVELVRRFERIVYVSCNPHTLRDNLASLIQTHEIEALALFDQFPYTDHMESGVILRRR